VLSTKAIGNQGRMSGMWRYTFAACVVAVASTSVAARPADGASAQGFSYELERRPQESGLPSLNATGQRRLTESDDETTCLETCSSEHCDYWHMGNSNTYTCSELELDYDCDCSGCNTCSCDPKDEYIRVNIMDSYGDGA